MMLSNKAGATRDGFWCVGRSVLASLAVALVVMTGSALPVLAQGPESLFGKPESSDITVEEATDSKLQRFDTPREAFRFFLETMLADQPELVVESGVMDLSRLLEADRTKLGIQRATQLYEVLNRTEYIDVDALDEVGAAQNTWKYEQTPPGVASGEVVVGFKWTEKTKWRISSLTVGRIQSMWDEFYELPTIEQYRENMPLVPYLRMTLRENLPDILRQESFLLENWQWIGLGALVLLGAILDRITRIVLSLLLRRLAGRTRMEQKEVVRFERPVGVLIGAWLFQALLPILGIKAELRTLLDLAAGTLATFAGVWAAYRLVDVICVYLAERARMTENRFDDMLVPLLRRTLKIFVTIVGLIYLASLMSEDLWGVVAGLSIGSLAVGFAARDSIENLFGTFTVLLDKPFQLGDWIVTDGIEGTVEEVGFRSTRIRTFYDSVISVPNRHFISSPVDNLGKRRYRRIKTMLSLTYDTPPEKVEAFCEGVREVLRKHPFTRKDYYHVYLNAFSGSSLDVLLYCFLECPDWGTELREKQRLYLDVLRVAQELNVEFAFPTQSIHVVKPEDLEHADRPANDMEGTKRGRETGGRVASGTLKAFGGKRPSPVGYDDAYFAEQIGQSRKD